MNRKKIVFAVLGLGALVAVGGPVLEHSAWAGNGMHAKGGHANGMGRMAAELGLTDAQKVQLKTIRSNAQAQHMAIRNNTKLTPEQKRAAMKTLRQNTKAQMSAVLTPAQRQKWAAMRAEHKAEHKKK